MKVNRPEHATPFFEAGLRCTLTDEARRELETGLAAARKADAEYMVGEALVKERQIWVR